MTPVSIVASAVPAKPPPTPAGDAAPGDGQAAFLDALLALIADVAGLPQATQGEPADGSTSPSAIPLEDAASGEGTDDRAEIDWTEVTLIPAPAAATPVMDASASPVAEPIVRVASDGVPDPRRGTTPPTTASLAPDIPPDFDAPATAAHTDNSAPHPSPSAGSPGVDTPATTRVTDNPAHGPVDGSRNDREPGAPVTMSARSDPGAPSAGEAETVAAVRAELTMPASDQRGMVPPTPVRTGRTPDARDGIAARGKNDVDASTPTPDEGARTGNVSPADFADRDAAADPLMRPTRETHESATPSHTAPRSDIATHDATAATAAQAGAPPVGAGTRGPAPTTIVAVPVPAGRLAEIVSQEVAHATPKGEHRLEITLHPPELGRVEVNMVVGRDSVQAHLVAHTEGARDLLSHHLAELREQLVAQGFADPRLSVDLRHGSGDRGGYRADRRSDPSTRGDGDAAPAPGAARTPSPRDRHVLHLIA
jgi:hypothetical protein